MTLLAQKKEKNLLDNKRFVVFLFFIIGFSLYANTFGNKFLFDDYAQVLDNQYVKNFEITKIFTKSITNGAGLADNFYRPLVSLSLALDYKLWGENPVGFHFVNIILHILSAILILFIFRSLQSNRIVSFLTSLLFLIHPLQVEAVAYISGRTDLIPTFWMLLSLFLFIKFFRRHDKKHIFYVLSLSSFALALLSKELSVIFPILLLIVYFVFIKKELVGDNIKKGILYILPFVMAVIGYFVIRLRIIPFVGAYDFYQDPFNRVLSFLKVILLYWGILLFPHNLRFRFDHAFPLSTHSPEVVASLIILAVIVYFSIRSLKKERKLFFGFSWFFVALAPASAIVVPLFSIIAERWLRLPSIGVFYLASLGIVLILGRLKEKPGLKKVFLTGLVAYFMFLSITTVIANLKWRDTITFFNHAREYYPNAWVVYANLSVAYDVAGDKEAALDAFKKTVELNPDNPAAHDNLASFYYNHGQYDLATPEYERAIEINKSFVKSYQPLAQIYVFRKQYDVAIIYLERLRELLPDSPKPYSLLGQAYVLKGDYVKAKENIEKSLSIKPKK